MSGLEGCTLGNTPALTAQGLRTWAKVLSVFDGDTVTLAIPCYGGVFKFSARINGIDTPEMKGPHKDRAYAARNRLCQLMGLHVELDDTATTARRLQAMLQVKPTFVWVVCGAYDKYGRVLVDAYSGPESPVSLGSILIDEGHAYAYNGGTKARDPLAGPGPLEAEEGAI